MKIKFFIIALLLLAAGCNQVHQASEQAVPSKAASAKNGDANIIATKPTENCLDGFALVPGSALYKTPDFCVMKYDAKAVFAADPSIGIQPQPGDPCFGTTNAYWETRGQPTGTYKNNGTGCQATAENGKEINSVPSGAPIAYIPEVGSGTNNAVSYCRHMGWHLLTNAEWMTIARNVEQVSANWCNPDGTACGAAPGTPGKILANGHNNAQPNSALVASADDSQACFGTTPDGSKICGHANSQKRTLQLSNGQVIWDFAGNVWQWVGGTVRRKDEPQSQTNGKLDSGWLSSEFAPGSASLGVLDSVIINNGRGLSMGYDSFRPSNPNWNSSNGVGRIFHFSAAADQTSTIYGFIRGGQWNHGAVDGAFSVHLTPVPSKTNLEDVGFRCVAAVTP